MWILLHLKLEFTSILIIHRKCVQMGHYGCSFPNNLLSYWWLRWGGDGRQGDENVVGWLTGMWMTTYCKTDSWSQSPVSLIAGYPWKYGLGLTSPSPPANDSKHIYVDLLDHPPPLLLLSFCTSPRINNKHWLNIQIDFPKTRHEDEVAISWVIICHNLHWPSIYNIDKNRNGVAW